MEKYEDIMDAKSIGLCEHCDYGIERCLKEGQAYCKSKEKENEQKEPI